MASTNSSISSAPLKAADRVSVFDCDDSSFECTQVVPGQRTEYPTKMILWSHTPCSNNVQNQSDYTCIILRGEVDDAAITSIWRQRCRGCSQFAIRLAKRPQLAVTFVERRHFPLTGNPRSQFCRLQLCLGMPPENLSSIQGQSCCSRAALFFHARWTPLFLAVQVAI